MIASSVHLEFNDITKKYRLVDTTDYLNDYGLDVTDPNINIRLFGTIYFNTAVNQQHLSILDPLIDLESGAVVSAWYDLPTDSNGDVVHGTWTADVSLFVGSTFQVTVPNTTTLTIAYYPFLADFLIAGNTITLAATSQVVTVVSATNDVSDTDIVVSSIITGTPVLAIITIANPSGSLTHTYSGCNKKVAAPAATYNCDQTTFGTFTGYDNTVYGDHVIDSTTLRIMHPAWTVVPYSTSDSVTTQDSPISKTLNQLYTGEWYVKLDSTVSYTQVDGAVHVYAITATIKSDVTCAGTLCGKLVCIKNLLTSVVADLQRTGTSDNLGNLLIVLTQYSLAKEYARCGDYESYKAALAAIDAALNASECDCNCCDDTQLIRIENVDPETANAITELYVLLQYRLFDGVPGVNEDSGAGYLVGTVLQDYNTGIEYRCTDNTVGAAIWVVYDHETLIYKVALTQSGSSAPTGTPVRNDLAGIPVFAISATGLYTVTLASAFPVGTLVHIGSATVGTTNSIKASRVDNNTIAIETLNGSDVAANSILNGTYLLIEVPKT